MIRNSTAARSFSSTVTSKLQRRREALIKSRYPEYAGNTSGKRLGGSFADPSKSPGKLDGSERFFDLEELQADFSRGLEKASTNPAELSRLLREYRSSVDENERSKRPMSEVKREKINQITKNLDYTASVKKAVVHKLRKHAILDGSVGESELLVPPLESKSDLRESGLIQFLESKTHSFVELYSQRVPSVVTSSLEEYKAAKKSAILFDESFRQLLSMRGQDAMFVIDHFATAAVRSLNVGDAIDTCIVDSKGYVLSTAVVLRQGEREYSILLAGNSKDRVFRYLAQYVVYSRQSGLDVSLEPVLTDVYSLYGPLGAEVMAKNAPSAIFGHQNLPLPSPEYLKHMLPMSFVTVDPCGSIILKHLDHYLLVVFTAGQRLHEVLYNPDILHGGVYALDMLRMETGTVRTDLDCPSVSTSPVKASLTHMVDQKKVREKILFGHERISSDLLKGTSHKRVLIVASSYVYGGCKILSSPHRHVIGETTSCAWNPELKRRVCQAYIKTEYAVPENPILVNVPLAIPERIEYRFKRRIVRQGAFRTVFRKLIPALVRPHNLSHNRDNT